MNIRDIVEQEGYDHMRRNGITPGWRRSNSPETFQSDLVEESADKIMSDREELSTVLGTIFEGLAPPAVTDFLALLTNRLPADPDDLSEEFRRADAVMTLAVTELVYKYCAREAGL